LRHGALAFSVVTINLHKVRGLARLREVRVVPCMRLAACAFSGERALGLGLADARCRSCYADELDARSTGAAADLQQAVARAAQRRKVVRLLQLPAL
jgi:hypothetical protein